MKLINSKRQPANLKILPTKEEFSNEEVGVKKCQDSRCECFELLLLSKEHALKNINKTFRLEILTYCNSLNAIYVVLCSGCLEEYIGETGVGKTRLRDRIIMYIQHIKQPERQQLRVEEHIRICGRDSFKIFRFFRYDQMTQI